MSETIRLIPDYRQQDINLCELLKKCPVGEMFYSTVYGDVVLVEVCEKTVIFLDDHNETHLVRQDGKFHQYGEVTVFPAKDYMDWSRYKPNLKHKFKVGDKIKDATMNNGYVYEVLEVLNDRYKVTCFGRLMIYEQNDFVKVEPEIIATLPKPVYWFRYDAESGERLLQRFKELTEVRIGPGVPCPGSIIFNVGYVAECRGGDSHKLARTAMMFGTELKIK